MRPGPVIGLTVGDPAGIGPELVKRVASKLGRTIRLRVIGSTQGVQPGKPTLAGAHQARQSLEESVRLLQRGEIHAVVNGPVSKEWLAKAGFRFPGQTEFYARRFGQTDDSVTMCMVGPRLRVALAGTHLSLRRAVSGLKPAGIVRAGQHLAELLRRIGIQRPRIAICGLNPHAGEQGLFGKEDARVVAPAVRQLLRKTRLSVAGPEPADTVFRRAVQGEFDGVVALYHDQGLIPAKLLDFDRTVNVTMGLPVIRCSPDHGTAFGLAGKGKAKPDSMIEAVKMAFRLAKGKR
ncbi:MAG: Pyridoxal phosphate biosynthesis protein [Verrucomicrobiota bacterium]